LRANDADGSVGLGGHGGREDEQREGEAEPRHHASPPRACRISAQSRNAPRTVLSSPESTTTGSSETRANSSSRSAHRSSCKRARRTAARGRSRTSRASPFASAISTRKPSTRGKLRSQTGSWSTTGIASHRRSSTRSHSSDGGRTRKSERTNTNVPAGTERGCAKRNSKASSTFDDGARNCAPSSSRSWYSQRDCEWGGSQKGSPSPSPKSR